MEKTSRQRWVEQISQHRKRCQKILAISRSIRYVGLINEYGRTLTGIIRHGMTAILSDEPARNEFFLTSILLSMRKKASHALGNTDYVIFRHDKVTIIAFQRDEGTYYISVSKNMTPKVITKTISKIKKVI